MDDDYKYWRIRKKPVLIVLGLLFLIWSWLIVNSANYADYSIRTKVSKLMVVSTVIKEKISEEILETQSETISTNLFEGEWPTNASEYLNYSFLTDRGKIFLFSEKLGVLLTFTPTLVRDKKGVIIDITWACFGLPKKNVSANCR